MTRPAKPSPRPSPGPAVPGVVSVSEVYTWPELCKRMRWARHAARQAKRMGLPTVKVGSRCYVLGSSLAEWLGKLADEQHGHKDGDGAEGRSNGRPPA